MKLLITTDVINNNEDLEYLIPLMLTAISYTDINDSLFNYNALKADILDALIDDRMSDYYTESSIDETLSYILSFMRQKEKEHEVEVNIKEFRVSLTTLNKICIILKLLCTEKETQ